jgi:hypothetical protein
MGKIEAHARGLIVTRVARLQQLLDSDAPDSLVAAEADLIGDAAILLDPAGVCQRAIDGKLHVARADLGLCREPGCEAELAKAGHEEPVFCAKHEDEFDRMVREAGGIQ